MAGGISNYGNYGGNKTGGIQNNRTNRSNGTSGSSGSSGVSRSSGTYDASSNTFNGGTVADVLVEPGRTIARDSDWSNARGHDDSDGVHSEFSKTTDGNGNVIYHFTDTDPNGGWCNTTDIQRPDGSSTTTRTYSDGRVVVIDIDANGNYNETTTYPNGRTETTSGHYAGH